MSPPSPPAAALIAFLLLLTPWPWPWPWSYPTRLAGDAWPPPRTAASLTRRIASAAAQSVSQSPPCARAPTHKPPSSAVLPCPMPEAQPGAPVRMPSTRARQSPRCSPRCVSALLRDVYVCSHHHHYHHFHHHHHPQAGAASTAARQARATASRAAGIGLWSDASGWAACDHREQRLPIPHQTSWFGAWQKAGPAAEACRELNLAREVLAYRWCGAVKSLPQGQQIRCNNRHGLGGR